MPLIMQPTHAKSTLQEDLDRTLRVVKDYPKPGITFRDIQPLLLDEDLRDRTLEDLARQIMTRFNDVELIVGLEARGFIFGAMLAGWLKRGFVMARKPNKLPGECIEYSYAKEYGVDRLVVQRDAILPGQRVVVVDDVLATGGTAEAAGKLVLKAGGVLLGYAFVTEILSLQGRKRIGDDVVSASTF